MGSNPAAPTNKNQTNSIVKRSPGPGGLGFVFVFCSDSVLIKAWVYDIYDVIFIIRVWLLSEFF